MFSRDNTVLQLLTREQELERQVEARDNDVQQLAKELADVHDVYAVKMQEMAREFQGTYEVH